MKRISSAGGGAVAYEELPIMDGIGSPGTVSEWARGDHVHPTDETRQDLLFGELGPNQNIKTVNNEPILGSGNIRIATLDGGEMNIIEEVDVMVHHLK